ncbi:hypothetical protein NL676_030164 [Syzygium grande]|nr:hypothetical protein NL676_030164 [Syzygium grande]
MAGHLDSTEPAGQPQALPSTNTKQLKTLVTGSNVHLSGQTSSGASVKQKFQMPAIIKGSASAIPGDSKQRQRSRGRSRVRYDLPWLKWSPLVGDHLDTSRTEP